MVLRLTALLAVGWAAACASAGPGLGGRDAAPGWPSHSTLQWHCPAAGTIGHAGPLDDLDDDDERWKGFRLACIPTTGCHRDDAWHSPSSDLRRLTSPLPPPGPTPPRLPRSCTPPPLPPPPP